MLINAVAAQEHVAEVVPEHLYEPPHDKTNKMTVSPAKTRICLLCAFNGYLLAKGPSFLHADKEDSDQTRRMPRLICLRWAHMPFCWFCHEAAHIAMRDSLRQNFILGWDKQAETEKSLTAIERDFLVPCVRIVYHRWCNHRKDFHQQCPLSRSQWPACSQDIV